MKKYYLEVEAPNEIVKLEINHSVTNKENENIQVILSTKIQGKENTFKATSTEAALILLSKSLPKKWRIKSCLSCRFGHFCPCGDYDNELFCVTDFNPKNPRDIWHVTTDNKERKKRCRTLFECCENHQEESKDYFTYSDYYYTMYGEK